MTRNAARNLVWMDLEMTGLDPETDRVLEVAAIVTNSDLDVLAEGPVLYVSQAEELLGSMDGWNTTHHTDSGLLELVREEGVSEREAEVTLLDFVSSYVDAGKSPLCGNSVGHDRRFLVKYMPELANHFHYRNLDVSTIKELAIRWRPGIAAGVVKKNNHRALDDIRESIEELKYYREHFFRTG